MTSAPGAAQHAQGDLVGHGPRRDEDGGRLAHPLGVGLLEGVDGGVVAVAVVAHLGLGHGPAHLGRGAGDGVAAEVDEARRLRSDAVAGAMPSMLPTAAGALPVVAGAGGCPGRRRRSATSASSGSTAATRPKSSRARADVAGPLVEVGQDVPLPEVAVAGVAEVAGRAGGGEQPGWPRRASPARPGRRPGPGGPRRGRRRRVTRRAARPTGSRRGGGVPWARWQSMITGIWLGSSPESRRAASRCLTASRQRPSR